MPITVVIPLFNKEPHIARALDSVFRQDYQEFEIIVVDDGSTDESAKIVSDFKNSRIHFIKQNNQGVSVARNKGVSVAKYDLIAFLDADDEWEKEHLKELARLYVNFPDCGAYATSYCKVTPDGSVTSPFFKAIPEKPWEGVLPNYFKSAALGEPPVWTSAVAIPRHIFDDVGNFKPGEKMGEDLDMWGRIALKWEVAFSTKQTAIYHLDASGRACVENQVLEKQLPFVETVNSLKLQKKSPYYLQMYVNEMKFLYIESLLQKGNGHEAKKEFCSIDIMTSKKINYIRFALLVFLPYSLVCKIRKIKKSIKSIVSPMYKY